MKKIDMTRGPIMKNIILFALPIIAGNILQYLYTTVDTLVIGNYCDHTALAAVGTSSQPVEVLLCIFLGIGTGVSILISQHVGANDRGKINDACKTAISFVYLCGIPISILGWFIAPFILKMMSVPSDVMDSAVLYTRIVLCSAMGNIGYNMNAGILRGIGDSKASLYFLIVSCITNIILDVVLVASFGMGVGGVAIATGTAMYLAWIVSMIYIKRRYPELEFTFLPRGLVKKELRSIISIGLPIGLNNSLFSFGHVALQTLVNEQGSVFMAGWSVSGRVNGIANMAISGISSAATTFSGQNFGAGRIDRLREGQFRIPAASGAITLAFGLIFIVIRMPILRLFTDEPEVLAYAGGFVAIMMLSQWMFAVFNGISCIVNGTGRVRYTTLINMMMLWAVRIPVAYLISRFIDGDYIMYCFPISFGFGMFCMIGYYLFCPSWKKLMRTAEKPKRNMYVFTRSAFHR
ncbi:MAG: MATE family efflux transporter [Lachnospiraceae bacterium]|nr:MATE family efflux transporter [Lachnospiraceae bacterium]